MYPMGYFYSSTSVDLEFFCDKAKAEREDILISKDTPFLYNIVMGMLKKSLANNKCTSHLNVMTDKGLLNDDGIDANMNHNTPAHNDEVEEVSPLIAEGTHYMNAQDTAEATIQRFHWVRF